MRLTGSANTLAPPLGWPGFYKKLHAFCCCFWGKKPETRSPWNLCASVHCKGVYFHATLFASLRSVAGININFQYCSYFGNSRAQIISQFNAQTLPGSGRVGSRVKDSDQVTSLVHEIHQHIDNILCCSENALMLFVTFLPRDEL